nr:hypothetical protein [Flavobacterium soli]
MRTTAIAIAKWGTKIIFLIVRMITVIMSGFHYLVSIFMSDTINFHINTRQTRKCHQIDR